MLPPGLGRVAYAHTFVGGPDDRPINVDGRHPAGDYSDLVRQPIRNIIGLAGQVHQALHAAYASFPFDPSRPSAFTVSRGNPAGSAPILPGNQYKVPYALQFNIGWQRELMPGTVLSADYIENRGVGLPILAVDYERRFDAGTLNVAAARAQLDRVLSGRTVDQWIAANPAGMIGAFGLAPTPSGRE